MAIELPSIVSDALDVADSLLGKLEQRVEKYITRAIGNVASQFTALQEVVLSPIRDALDGVHDTLTGFYSTIVDSVSDRLDEIGRYFSHLESRIVDMVEGGLREVDDTVRGLGGSFFRAVDTLLVPVEEFISEKSAVVVNFIDQQMKDVSATVAEFGTRLEEYMGTQVVFMLREVKDGLESLGERIRDGVKGIPLGMWEALSPDVQERLEPLIRKLETNEDVTPELLALTRPGALPLGVVGAFLAGFALPLILSQTINTLLVPLTNKLMQAESKLVRHALLTPDELVGGVHRGIIPQDHARDTFARLGYTDVDIDHLLRLGERYPDESMLLTAWHRGYVGEGDLAELFHRLGWRAEWMELHKALSWAYPAIPDLIRMAVREVFTPEVVESFQLDEDYPTGFDEIAAKAGLSQEWARNYWRAHWELPSPEQGFEMFHRTVDSPLDPNADEITLPSGAKVYNVIGRRTLDLLLRTLDVMPFWRDKLPQIAYAPLTRVDIRRMHKMGVLDEDGVYRAHLDLGYSPEHARLLTDFVIALNREEEKEERAPERDLSKTEVLKLYKLKILDGKTTAEYLSALGYDEREVQLLIQTADYQELAEQRSAAIERVKLRYQKGLITLEQAERELTMQALPASEVESYLLKWMVAKPVTVRYPTTAQLDAMVQQGIISVEEYYKTLVEMGYSETWAQRLTELLKKKGVGYGRPAKRREEGTAEEAE